jgi:hypothetical protein
MKQKFELKDLGKVVISLILTDGEKDIEADATFENSKDALQLLNGSDRVESVELDPEQTEESDTVFHFRKDDEVKKEIQKKEVKEGIRIVNPIIKKDAE